MTRAVLLVCLVVVAVFGIGLSAPLLDPQEARYAQIPLEMAGADDWTTPRLRGQPYLDKPPLLYWLVGAAYGVFGPGDGPARVVPALAAVGTIVITGWWGRRVFGPHAGLAAACVLTLAPGFAYYGRLLTFDGLLSLWVTASLAAGDIARASAKRRAWWLASAVFAALGVLAKGPVALVLVVPVLFTWQLAEGGPPTLRLRAWLAWGGIAMIVALPWFVAAEARTPGFLVDFIWHHHFERYSAAFDHEEPAWFFLPRLVVGLLPWVVFLPAAMRCGAARRYLLAGVWVVAFFSAGGCKRATYVLPAYPLFALGLGACLAEPARAVVFRRVAAATAGVAVFGVAFLWPDYARRFSKRNLLAAVPPSGEPVYCSARLADSASYYLPSRRLIVLDAHHAPDVGSLVVLASAERDAPTGWSTETIARQGRAAVVRLVARR
jgi:4-amino-4-deoxy-L-arabinose transferase-like glycosyltransferase